MSSSEIFFTAEEVKPGEKQPSAVAVPHIPPELANGFLAPREKFPLNELRLMDIDKEHMVAATRAPFKAILSTNQRAVIAGAEAHVTQPLRHSC
ncbi:MAG TPA: hypothetical protein VHP14_07240 [Anaerolineales bacterium]|nr:hypothetical protein [Anaerolineales bacterium]